jgi:carbonic anhydrase
MRATERILLGNKAWSHERRATDPQFFERLAREQRPEFLWIGCADSRVPANQVTDTEPGEIFVHRNIANLVTPDDANLESVVQYAVSVLQVKHVIVCGHLGCGGIRAAMGELPGGNLGRWLGHIRATYDKHRAEIDALPPEARADKLCDLNVRQQVVKLAKNPDIEQAWREGRPLWVHGWLYGLRDGLLRELVCQDGRARHVTEKRISNLPPL